MALNLWRLPDPNANRSPIARTARKLRRSPRTERVSSHLPIEVSGGGEGFVIHERGFDVVLHAVEADDIKIIWSGLTCRRIGGDDALPTVRRGEDLDVEFLHGIEQALKDLRHDAVMQTVLDFVDE